MLARAVGGELVGWAYLEDLVGVNEAYWSRLLRRGVYFRAVSLCFYHNLSIGTCP